jgi:hypothetical protein
MRLCPILKSFKFDRILATKCCQRNAEIVSRQTSGGKVQEQD